MNVWLIKDSEVLPIDEGNQRLARMALIAEQLASAGDTVTWWTSSFSHFEKKFRKYENIKVNVHDNYSIFLLKTNGYVKNVSIKRLIHNWKIANGFYSFAKSENFPDVILVDLPTISFVYKAIKFGRKHNVPVIVDVRDLNPDVFPDAFNGIKKAIVKVGIIPLQIMLKNSMKKATAIVGTTQPYLDYGLKYASRRQRKDDKVFYVAYPDNKDPLNKDSVEKWDSYKLDGKTVICFFGQFGNMVDIETVVNAARKCKNNNLDVVFMLCGNGERVEEYKRTTKELDNMIFPGWVNKDDIRALGAISTAGLMAYKPSKNYELQMPNKFSEYLSMGLVILLQPDGLMKSVIEDKRCGYSYKSPDDLVSAIEDMIRNKRTTESMKLNSRRLYEQKFSAEKIYKEYADYIHMIGKRK